MPHHSDALLEPRKRPVQARSSASVEAILDATVQVLLSIGKDRLTTTRVALRAGVSVGTLYQYFPNKKALLQAVLRRHLEAVTQALERACLEQAGNSLQQMATAVIHAFLEAKMQSVKTSVALYSVSSDVDGAKIAQRMAVRSNKALVEMLETACEALAKEPQLVASMIQGTIAGMSRRLLESDSPEKEFKTVRDELVFLVCTYLEARSSGASLR